MYLASRSKVKSKSRRFPLDTEIIDEPTVKRVRECILFGSRAGLPLRGLIYTLESLVGVDQTGFAPGDKLMTEMTSGIGDLLQRLRKDGVEAGETERRRILQDAQDQASAVVAEAQARAKEIIAAADAEVKAKRTQLNAELTMAARDFALRFSERIKKQAIAPLVRSRVGDALNDADVLKEALIALLRERTGGAKVTVSPETRSKLEGYFLTELARMMEGGKLEIVSEEGLTGFRLQRAGETFTWDVTGEAVAQELAALVDPVLRKHLQITPTNR